MPTKAKPKHASGRSNDGDYDNDDDDDGGGDGYNDIARVLQGGGIAQAQAGWAVAGVDLASHEPASEDAASRVSTESLPCYLPSCSCVFVGGSSRLLMIEHAPRSIRSVLLFFFAAPHKDDGLCPILSRLDSLIFFLVLFYFSTPSLD